MVIPSHIDIVSLNGSRPNQVLKKNFIIVSLFVSTILIMGFFNPFVWVYSQQPNEEDTVTDVFLNLDFVYGFLGAMGGLIPIVVAVAYFLKKSVNSATKNFIERQTTEYEKTKRETREQMQDYQSSVKTQIDTVNNNVNEKFNASKESIIEIKRTLDDVDEKLDESRTQNTENRMRLQDVDRRLTNLELNRSSHNPMGRMGTG